MLEVQIRPATDSDLNLVHKSWMRSYRKSVAMQWVSDSDYNLGMQDRIWRIIRAPGTRVLMASPPDDTITAFGFIVAGPAALHYVWTKEAWRRMGVARRLALECFPTQTPSLTHVTKMGEQLWQTKMPSAHYDPFGVP